MRVVIAHNRYLERGGEDTVVEAEHAMLESHGHEVVRFTVSNEEIAEMSSWAVARRTVWNRDMYSRLRAATTPFRPDVVHFHNTLPLISPAGYAAARAEGAAVVQTLHNYRLVCPSGLMYRSSLPCDLCVTRTVAWPGVLHGCYRGSRAATATVAAMLAWHRMTGTYHTLVDRFIALTTFARAAFTRGGLDPEKVVVKPNFLADDPGMGSGGGGYAVFVGRLSDEKGVLDLLEAWRGLDGARLRIIGDGPLERDVRNLSAPLHQVKVLGRLPRAETVEQIAHAKVLVFPSRCHEGMPMTIIESLANGTPVVAYGHGAAAEMIDHERTGWLVKALDVEELARRLRSVMSDPDEALSMRPAARAAFEANYGSVENHARLVSIYRAAMGARGR